MAFMEFNESLAVGNTVMDHEHRNLVRYINVLQQSIASGAGHEVIDEVLAGLTDYAATHFLVEESLMKAYDYPDIGRHKQAHTRFRQRLNELSRLFSEQHGQQAAQTLLDFLMSWLIDHILQVDARLADFLHSRGMR